MSTSTALLHPDKLRMARDAVATTGPKQQQQLTPSWTSIVEAYHKEGAGDREMLLALLHAKAKEDERLAAMDLLKAEQMRAYSTHIAVHGPLYPAAGPAHAKPAPRSAAPLPHVTVPPSPAAASSSSVSTSSHRPRQAASTATAALGSCSVSSSDSSRSRAPSLTNSMSSRQSSPPSPLELCHQPAGIPLLRVEEEDQKLVLTAAQALAYNSLPSPPPHHLKRKRFSQGEEGTQAWSTIPIELVHQRQLPAPKKRASPIVASRRASPTTTSLPASLPSIASFDILPDLTGGPSLQHILNCELRPLLSATRLALSDLRSSSSDDG